MLEILAAEGEHNPVIPIWQELIIGAVAFAFLCWILMKYVFPRMEETFRARVDADYRDYLVWEREGEESLAALSNGVAAALRYLCLQMKDAKES